MLRVASFTFNPFQENTFVVHDGREAIVIDPGCWNGEEEHELEEYLTGNALTPVRLVLTHSHIDHVLGCAWMHKRYQLRPELHKADMVVFDRVEDMAHIYGLHCDPPPEPAGYLTEGEVVTLGGHSLRVRFVPGHSPGHIALHSAKENFVIAGDVLFNRSIGRTDLPGADHATLEKSIREKLYSLNDITTVYCGHGPSTTIGDEKRHNPFVRPLR